MVRTNIKSIGYRGITYKVGDCVLVRSEDNKIPWVASISNIFYEGKGLDVDKLRKSDINLNVTWFYRVSDVQVFLLQSIHSCQPSIFMVTLTRTSISVICQ